MKIALILMTIAIGILSICIAYFLGRIHELREQRKESKKDIS